MNELKVFKNEKFGSVRTLVKDGEIWFVGKDVCAILGYKDTSDALKRHVDDEDKLTRCFTDSGQSRKMYIINESGLYSLVLSSKMPEAKPFKRWVTSEVIPSIRKRGFYSINQQPKLPSNYIEALKALVQSEEEKLKLESKIEEDKPKVLFAEAVSNSDSTILIGELAKLLKQNGIETGEKRLFKYLRDNGYLISRKGSDYNLPTQKSMELGLFTIKENIIKCKNGEDILVKTTKVTGKGQLFFINKLKKFLKSS